MKSTNTRESRKTRKKREWVQQIGNNYKHGSEKQKAIKEEWT